MCHQTYCRIEEVPGFVVLEEGDTSQSRAAIPECEKNDWALFTRPRPLAPHDDGDDDRTEYSRVQVIDTSFQLKRATHGETSADSAPALQTLSKDLGMIDHLLEDD